ncbi:MAG: glycosyltransferase [Opitutus sp.]
MSTDLARHFDRVSETGRRTRSLQTGFHRQIAELLAESVYAGSRILEIGCGSGDLLRLLQPSRGLGLDLSAGMIGLARHADQSSKCEYRVLDEANYQPGETFDFIVLDFLVTYLADVQQTFERLHSAAHPGTRLCITSVNNAWAPFLAAGRYLGFVMHQPPGNWLTSADLINLLELSGWEVEHSSTELIFPFRVRAIEWVCNRLLVRLPGFSHLGSILYLRARTAPHDPVPPVSCSVVVPVRNEAGNIRDALARIPVLGSFTEVIFVEGGSSDDTWGTIQRELASYRGPLRTKLLKQVGDGKWNAVRIGFAAASGEILVIQDGDLTAPPEDLPKFYRAIGSGLCDFANGSRLVYPLERQAMRFLNLVANKFFAIALSYVIGQPIKDSLCGTKMLRRSDYERLLPRIGELGNFDPFGDFNLLFGAALVNLRIRDIPVPYRDRTYGQSNISRFRHGWLLLKMTIFGLIQVRPKIQRQ